MTKLNNTVYQKILLQTQEAQVRELKKLASAVLNGLGSLPRDEENFSYSFQELRTDIYNGLWKLAFDVVGYHDLESTDIQKVDETICVLANKFIKEMETVLEVNDKVGPNEPKLMGEK